MSYTFSVHLRYAQVTSWHKPRDGIGCIASRVKKLFAYSCLWGLQWETGLLCLIARQFPATAHRTVPRNASHFVALTESRLVPTASQIPDDLAWSGVTRIQEMDVCTEVQITWRNTRDDVADTASVKTAVWRVVDTAVFDGDVVTVGSPTSTCTAGFLHATNNEVYTT